MTFDLSEGGDFGAVLMSCKVLHLCTDGFIQATLSQPHAQMCKTSLSFVTGNGAFWLDIYNFPLKSWLADLKQAAPQSQVMKFYV